MRAHLAGLALGLTCCSFSAVDRQRLADGSWQVTCRLPMAECALQADALCMDQRYVVVRGKSRHVVHGAGPSAVDYRVSEISLVCGDSDDASPPAGLATPSIPGSVDSARATKPVCAPGTTLACVGPGGCSGGQACVPDGSGFGPCDCGPVKGPSADAG